MSPPCHLSLSLFLFCNSHFSLHLLLHCHFFPYHVSLRCPHCSHYSPPSFIPLLPAPAQSTAVSLLALHLTSPCALQTVYASLVHFCTASISCRASPPLSFLRWPPKSPFPPLLPLRGFPLPLPPALSSSVLLPRTPPFPLSSLSSSPFRAMSTSAAVNGPGGHSSLLSFFLLL